MKNQRLNPVLVAAVLALASSGALAQKLDFSGSNIYMKFLDGDQRRISDASGDTASGADQGQWTEFELRIKATISRQVEAGVRLQSRSPASYWTNFGFANNEGFTDSNARPQQSKFMKLRGAYVLLTPGYSWLDQALIGSSDWGMFDPFTVGPVRYIDRDNYNGLYFKGSLPLKGASWEFARVSLPNYLQSNYGQGAACCSTDETQYNEAVYIGQVKGTLGPVKLASSYQFFNDRILEDTDGTDLNGRDSRTFARNQVGMLKAEGSVAGVDLKGALYGSIYKAPFFDQPWINSPKSDIRSKAIKLDAAFGSLPVPGLSVNYQYFNIGAGFYSNTAARRESDVLLTEGSEAAWHRWGQSIWAGGAAKDYQQSPASAKCFGGDTGGRCRGDSGLAAGANGLVDNDFMDFDEAPNESVQGWKGHTVVVNYEVAKIPMALEYTRLGYNYNWQGLPTSALANFFAPFNDRRTSIVVGKIGYVVPAMGGIELGAKIKRVLDKNGGQIAIAADDRETRDSGYTLSAGNQLFGDLYGAVSYGRYTRDIRTPALNIDNEKSITGIRLSYNLAGFETGLLSQWVSGDGDPGETGARASIKQYRMKAFVKAIF
ncbi:MAG: hypothetical protein HZC37_06055 [Burkholderiales bacterium]|nr:hypothetical protein [Burkholderiales bacterium]